MMLEKARPTVAEPRVSEKGGHGRLGNQLVPAADASCTRSKRRETVLERQQAGSGLTLEADSERGHDTDQGGADDIAEEGHRFSDSAW